jgi:hypothetical protein
LLSVGFLIPFIFIFLSFDFFLCFLFIMNASFSLLIQNLQVKFNYVLPCKYFFASYKNPIIQIKKISWSFPCFLSYSLWIFIVCFLHFVIPESFHR